MDGASVDVDDALGTVELRDGRVLSYLEQGERDGRPVLYHEGSPGHIRFGDDAVTIARQAGVRLISVHRPGYRRSTPRPHYRLLDIADDIAQLADQLGLDRFAIVGHSAGGPPTLACAWKLADRITRVCVSGGNAPFGFDGDMTGMDKDAALLFRLGRRAPFVVMPIMRAFGKKVAKDPRAFVERSLQAGPPSERAYYADPEIVDRIVEASSRQCAARMAGIGGDIEAVLAPWGFDLSEVSLPVDLWYGEQDASKIEHGRRLATLLPNATAHFLPDEGHEVIHTHLREVLAAVLS